MQPCPGEPTPLSAVIPSPCVGYFSLMSFLIVSVQLFLCHPSLSSLSFCVCVFFYQYHHLSVWDPSLWSDDLTPTPAWSWLDGLIAQRPWTASCDNVEKPCTVARYHRHTMCVCTHWLKSPTRHRAACPQPNLLYLSLRLLSLCALARWCFTLLRTVLLVSLGPWVMQFDRCSLLSHHDVTLAGVCVLAAVTAATVHIWACVGGVLESESIPPISLWRLFAVQMH